MAGAAELGYLFSFGDTFECLILGQFDIVLVGIASMTVLAAEPELEMNIGLESHHGRLKSFLQPLMAFHAGIFLSIKRQREARREKNYQEAVFFHRLKSSERDKSELS